MAQRSGCIFGVYTGYVYSFIHNVWDIYPLQCHMRKVLGKYVQQWKQQCVCVCVCVCMCECKMNGIIWDIFEIYRSDP